MSDDTLKQLQGLLSDLLVDARLDTCDCMTCQRLRRMWPLLDVDARFPDGAPQAVRPETVCAGCWNDPALAEIRRGVHAIVTVRPSNVARCVICGTAL